MHKKAFQGTTWAKCSSDRGEDGSGAGRGSVRVRQEQPWEISVVLKRSCASKSPLSSRYFLALLSKVSDNAGQSWVPIIQISKKFPGGADAAGPGTATKNHWYRKIKLPT